MFSKIIKYLLLMTILAAIIGTGGWIISKWFTINNPLPEGAIKVMGKFIKWY